ncbi:MAG: DUF4105 domain-containing protein [Verrucomicrobiota bacterium]
MSVVLALLFVLALIFIRGRWLKLAAVLAGFATIAAWWFTLSPSNDRQWLGDVAKTASAEIAGDRITLHNVRNFDYRTETDYIPRWETRTVDLSKLTGIDMAINYWGSPYMAHPVISFQFSDSPPVCFSIETRKEEGESYSAIGGIYRQFELIYIVADERDVIRVRTNYRKGEDIYLYRLNISPENARGRFMDYVTALNELHAKPRWYNAVTTNCTTSIRTQHASAKRKPWDWRILVNGKADEMLYEQGAFRTGGLSFEELRKRSLVNAAARAANDAPDFSSRIRANMPSFTEASH